MATSQQWMNLKGRGSQWTGLDLRSPLIPMPGQFRVLRNLYVTSDGTELRRIPGWRPVGLLSVADELAPSTVTPGNPTTVTFGTAHQMPNGGKLRITANGSTVDINGDHVVTVTGTNTLTIPVDSTSGTMSAGGTWRLSRAGPAHRVRQVRDRWAVIGEGVYGTSTGTKLSSITAWIQNGRPSPTSPPTSWETWRSSVLDHYFAGSITSASSVLALRRKTRAEVADERILIALPGFGCCWQADFRGEDLTSTQKQLQCLGTPKGLVADTTAVGATIGTGLAANDYYVAIAYVKDKTDEIGLMSEPFLVQTVPLNGTIDLVFAEPWHVLNEMPTNCSIAVFIGTSPDAMQLVDIVPRSVAIGTGTYNIQYAPTEGSFRALTIEQMPMGAMDLSYCRGFACYGGHLERSYDVEATAVSNNVTVGAHSLRVIVGPDIVGSGKIPPAYQGTRYYNPPGEPTYVYLDIMEFLDGGSGNIEWKTDSSRVINTGSNVVGKMILPVGSVLVSEQGFPHETPSVNQIPVDLLRGDGIEAIGRIGSGFVLASTRETYVLYFGRSPVGSEPYLISDQFGAISPIVECDGVCAWLSDRGPVICNGKQVTWIGQPVESLFRQAKRDSEGKMPHSVLGYDSTRKLIFFGIRTDRQDTAYGDAADDDEKSRVSCDSFLVYSLETGAWSVWDAPAHLRAVFDMAPLLCDDGIERLCFLAGDEFDVTTYAFDDTYADTIPSSALVQGTLASGNEGTQFSFTATGAIGTGTAARVGMGFMVTDSTGTVLRGYGIIRNIIDAFTVEFGALPSSLASESFPSETSIPPIPVTLGAGDRIIIGIVHASLQTLLFPWEKDWKGEGKITGIEVRHSFLDSSETKNFVKTTLQNEDSVGFVSLGPKLMKTHRVYSAKGDRRGQEHGITMDFVCTSPVAVKDVFFERGGGA